MYEFNLDTAIAAWRQSLKLNRAFTEDDLNELENHLRDHVDVLLAKGVSVEQAYRKAMMQLGSYTDLEPEYVKVRFGLSKRKRVLKTEAKWNLAMLGNYFKTSFRNIRRHKGFAAINIGGLAVGLAGCLLMGLYVQSELSYDQFNEKADRIYRLGSNSVGWPYGKIIEAEYPEVEKVVYMRSYPTYSITHEGQLLTETLLHAENSFFEVFDFPLVEGDPSAALVLPFTLVLSETLAEKLYGDEPALGRMLVLGDSLQFTVTGVARVPKRSHIQFDALLSFETLRARDSEWFDTEMSGGWLDLNVINYVLVKEGADAEALRAKITNLPMERAAEYLGRWGSEYKLNLEPLSSIYLRSNAGNQLGPHSDIDYVYLLSAVGLFLLLIAAINFTNLTTARSMDRAKEVGMRKAIGSGRGALVGQFLFGSFLTCALAGILAVLFAGLALPYFNGLALTDYSVGQLLTPQMGLLLVGVVIFVALLAGLYPAFSLSAFGPIEALKGRFSSGGQGSRLRQGLVVFQFAISGALIVGTLVVFSQLRFMKGQDLGFDAEQVLVLDARQAPGQERTRRSEVFKQELLSHVSVTDVSSVWTVPGRNAWRGQLSFPEGWPAGESIGLEYYAVGWDFVETFGLTVVAGRDFNSEFTLDEYQSVMINEAAVEEAGWASPAEAIGKRFASPGSRKPDGVVIGVVKNYHHHGLQGEITSMMYGIRSGNGFFALRLNTEEASSVLAHIASTWTQFFDGYPYDTFFLDDDFARQYEQEQRLMRIFGTFAILTIVIACLGLFGLAAFTASQRTKEIGIRKAMGATTPQLVALLSKDFLKLVVLSLIVATPLAYYPLNTWLADFAYRTGIGVEVFLITGGLLLVLALFSVSWQAMKAAGANPVDSLRYE